MSVQDSYVFFSLIKLERKENVGNTYKMDTDSKLGKYSKCLEVMLLKMAQGYESVWNIQLILAKRKKCSEINLAMKGQRKLYKVGQAPSNSLLVLET